MRLREAIQHYNNLIECDSEDRNDYIDLVEWLEELRDSRILINNIQKVLLSGGRLIDLQDVKNILDKIDPLE